MGYRSDVSLVLTRNAFAEMCKQLPAHLNTLVEWSDKFIQKDNSFLFAWNHVKWTEDSYYPEINAVYSLLRSLEDDQYHFCRLGEDNEDVEERGSYWDNPFDTGVIRQLNMNTDGATSVDLKVFM